MITLTEQLELNLATDLQTSLNLIEKLILSGASFPSEEYKQIRNSISKRYDQSLITLSEYISLDSSAINLLDLYASRISCGV